MVLALLTLICSALIGEGGKHLPEFLNRVGFGVQSGQYMFDDRASFLSRTYLQSMLDFEFRDYLGKGTDDFVLAKLRQWNGRDKSQSETQAESAFVQVFFVELWGHGLSGAGHEADHTIVPKYAIEGGSGAGNKGAADLALGWFNGDKKSDFWTESDDALFDHLLFRTLLGQVSSISISVKLEHWHAMVRQGTNSENEEVAS
jgi:hypothetical protein